MVVSRCFGSTLKRSIQSDQVQAVAHDFLAADVASPQGCAVGLEARIDASHDEIVAQRVRAHRHVLALIAQSLCNLSCHRFSSPS